jgi:hypothetical protein
MPAPLPLVVQLSSERASQAVRQDCSFSKKQELPPALLVGVQRRSAGVCSRRARSHVNAALCGVPVGTRSPGISSGGLVGHLRGGDGRTISNCRWSAGKGFGLRDADWRCR